MLIACNDVKKSYGDLTVLKGVSVEVKEAEFVTIIGKSGAGKSTLLHLLGTLDKPDSGTISINNRQLDNLSGNELAHFRNKHIGFVFQFHHLLPEFTALENIMMPGLILGTSKTILLEKAKSLMKRLLIADRGQHKPSQLSGGEQQRVAIARALINDPLVVLADEPTGNLDTNTSQEIYQVIADLRKDLGIGFVIVTHNMELDALSDRSLIMQDGYLIS